MARVLKSTLTAIGAQAFMEAKLKEFEAACYFGNEARVSAVEQDCVSAMSALLDAKRVQIAESIRNAGRE